MTCVEGVLGERTNIVEPELCYIDPEKLDLIWRRPSSALYVKMFEQQKREMPSEPLGTLKRTNIFLIMNIRNFIFGRRPGRYEGLCFAIKWLVLLSTIWWGRTFDRRRSVFTIFHQARVHVWNTRLAWIWPGLYIPHILSSIDAILIIDLRLPDTGPRRFKPTLHEKQIHPDFHQQGRLFL